MMATAMILLALMACFMSISAVFLYLENRRLHRQNHLQTTPSDNRRAVRKALRALNSTPRWGKDASGAFANYEYQGGHFRIRLTDSSPFAQLQYLSFYTIHAEQLELMRNICNQCNLNNNTCKLIYTVNSHEGTADMHIVASLQLSMNTAEALFKRTMEDVFMWKNLFIRRFEEVMKDAENAALADVEKAGMEAGRNLFLVREQEMMHQQKGSEWREEPNSGITIATLFARALGMAQILPVRMTIVGEDYQSQKVEADAIGSFSLSSVLIQHGRFVQQRATLFLWYFDRILPEKERQMMIHLSAEGGNSNTLYYRITATLQPLNVQKTVAADTVNNRTTAFSLLAAHDLRTEQSRKDEFSYLWKEAMAKLKHEGTDNLTDEERLLVACVNPQIGFFLYRGKLLFSTRCFMQAIPYLEYAYHTMHPYVGQQQPEVQLHFFDTAYMLGHCYNHLQQYDRAYYYLELLLPLHNMVYTEEYVNCLVNKGDLRAYGTIEGMLAELKKIPPKEREKGALAAFENFLRRRKAYLLVELQRDEEAEKMLRKMMDEPDNTDFAISELAILQKRKEERK